MIRIKDSYGHDKLVKDAQDAYILGWHMAVCVTPNCQSCDHLEDE